ncbi:gamma-glutamyltransferase family protein [Poseidonocella sp. HB161398]|uniref:gamma-glutamyltransferase family protein n=1 Tax=Poseidonocella sp. HB161398 TaxID=2320855 RepID=UPI001108F4FB|nr:gamma-glutamyltransferase [Poseidonocella sp. HB161398]
MLNSALGLKGAFTAPHQAATQAGLGVLAEGGSAIEAMVAAAAAVAVAYPHMNGIGGDGFWLVKRPGAAPVGIFAGGQAAGLATPDWYRAQGHAAAIPARGPLAALTVPGSVGGWGAALSLCDRPMPLSRLLAPAIELARQGIAVTGNQADCTAEKAPRLQDVPGFADIYMPGGAAPARGSRMRQAALGATLEQIARSGTEDYYRGEIAATHGAFLEAAGSPLRAADLAAYRPEQVAPLSVETSQGRLWNMTPPTQGIASLMILALFDRLGVTGAEGFAHLHGLIEATKQAFIKRNAELGDGARAQDWLAAAELDAMAARIDPARALPWPYEPKEGDTIWMGAADADGTVVSFIQSVFWEFGSGLTCPETGVVFQNRGAAFSLAGGPNGLAPGKRPFHTLNPAMAELSDGRILSYGTMGGEGQPQTQAAVFSRYAMFGQGLQQAVTAPRWLLGKTWGDDTTTLKLEDRFDPALVDALKAAGHQVEMIPGFSDLAGHAGAVVLHPKGLREAASDPRADGAALAL